MRDKKKKILCDRCKRKISVNIKKKRIGEIEYQYFQCPSCKKIYAISVTDGALRRAIEEYVSLQKKICIQKDLEKRSRLIGIAEDLMKKNLLRSNELSLLYPPEW